ncbi:MAG: hypothetical protein MJ100_00145 [Ruminococcus sp.]|nr:hypothetical protein [Ruminococcus sp.]
MNSKAETRSRKFGWEEILSIVLAAVIFAFNIQIVGKCFNPFVFHDEAGYWTHASYMAGLDWTGVSDLLAWYSYGYSILLVPILKLAPTPTIAYRSALVLNVLMMVGVYFMYIFIARFIFPKMKKYQTALISAAAALYTSYQHNTGIAFSEITLLFFTTLTAVVLIFVIKRPTFLNSGCLGILCAYIFMIHNRCIGIAASVCLVILLLFCFRRIKLSKAAVFAGTFAVGMALNSVFRHILETALWSDGHAPGNSASSIISNLRIAFSSLADLIRMLSVLCSQAFAASAATFGLVFFALWAVGRQVFRETADTIKKRKTDSKHVPKSQAFFLVFVFCAFISTWIISSVFMFNFTRIDHVIYTRYFDITIGLLIIAGLGYICDTDKYDLVFAAAIVPIMYIGADRADALMNSVTVQVFNVFCSPGLVRNYWKFGTNFYGLAMLTSAVFFVILIAGMIKKKNIGKILPPVIAAVLFTVYTGDVRKEIIGSQESGEGDRQLISRISDTDYDKIYVSADCGTFASFVQFRLPDERIEFADSLENIGEKSLFLADRNDMIKYIGYELEDISDKHILLRNKKRNENSEFEFPLSYMISSDKSLVSDDAILSGSESNYLCYGPYMKFTGNDYNITFELEDIVSDSELLGFAEVKSHTTGKTYAHNDITADMVKDGKLDLELDADIDTDAENVEMIVFIYEPEKTSMKLGSVKISVED